MKRFLIILAILTIAASASAAPPPFAIINPAQDSRIGTLTNTKWCYSDGSQVLCTQDAPAGAGDFLANGTVPMTGAIIPDSAGGQTIGTTSAEFGHIYLHNSKSIYFQADQSLYLTGAAGALSLTGGNFTPGASTLTLGSTAAEWGGLYLGDGKIIYGQADQSNTITSSATGWVFNLPVTTQSAKLTGGTNTFNITNGTASLDVAAGAALNIDTSLQVATGAVVLNGNAGGSSSLTLGNFALSLGGTMTDGRLCTYASSGTAISCNTATSTFQTADADLTAIAALTATRGDLMYVNSGGAWADLAIGAAGTVLQTNGADPSWALISADNLTNNTITATQLAAALTFADGDFIDLSAITMSGTNDEGITLPFWADVTPTSGATKRFMTWDESGSVLKIYTASGWTTINPSAGAPTDVAYLVTGSLSGSLSAERLLAEGTGIDFTDAGANGNFTIAVDTTEIGTTTWGAGSEVVWTFNASGGTDPTITFGNGTVAFAGTVSATAFSGNITGNVTGNCSGSAGTVTDTELAAIQGLTFADASIIQLTGAGAAAVLTSGGNNYVLKSTSDNSALEFAAPTGTGAPVLGTAPSFTTSITPNSAGASTIGTTSLEWGNVYLTDSAVIYGQADQSATLTSSASTWTASAFTVTGTLTANGNTVVGNANTDTLTVQSTIKGSGRAVTIDDDGTTSPTYATGTQELFVTGDIETAATVYAQAFEATGTGESYATFANNATTPEASITNGIYFVGNVLKVKENGTERDVVTPADSVTWTGTSHSFAGVTNLILPTATPDANGEIAVNNTNETLLVYINSGLKTLDFSGDSAGYVLKSNGSGTFTLQEDATGGTPTFDTVGDPSADVTIAMDASEEVNFNYTGNFTTGSQFKIEQLTGNPSGGVLFEVKAADTDITLARLGDGTNYTQFATNGNITLAGTALITAGGIVLGDASPDANGEIGYASNAYTLFANSEDLSITAGTNLWTFASSTSATFAFTPSVAFTGGIGSIGAASNLSGGTVTLGALAGAIDAGGATSFEIPNGTGPTVDAAGEIAVDTTTDQFVYYGGAKRVLPYKQYASFVIPAPAEADDINLLKAPYGMTISAINCIVQGTTSVTGQLQECDSAGANCADLDSDITCDADGAADDGSLTDSAIASAAWLRWKTTSVSGTPTFLTVTVTYSVVSD